METSLRVKIEADFSLDACYVPSDTTLLGGVPPSATGVGCTAAATTTTTRIPRSATSAAAAAGMDASTANVTVTGTAAAAAAAIAGPSAYRLWVGALSI